MAAPQESGAKPETPTPSSAPASEKKPAEQRPSPAAAPGAKAEPEASAHSERHEHVVARGRTIFHDGKYRGPGEKVLLSTDDVAHLRPRGFLVVPLAEEDVASTLDDGGATTIRPK